MEKKPILIVENDREYGKMLTQELSHNGFKVHLAGTAQEALTLVEDISMAAILSAVQLPDMNGFDFLERVKNQLPLVPVILMAERGEVADAVLAMRKGAEDYLVKPLAADQMETVIHRPLSNQPSRKEGKDLSLMPEPTIPMITQDPRMKEIIELCRKVASSKAAVLIRGESGTGKELLARLLHRQSSRNLGPFVAVNCASLPETLLESELFGHEKGAFTGAVGRKIGKFELAHKGTLLLDEISEMNTFLQAKILRVLQENEVDRIGGNRPIPIDIRVVATTNRDLASSIGKGEFREDLYYRLNVIEIHLPPLRERKQDIEILAHHFLKKFAEEYHRPVQGISIEGMAWLKQQEWRGNVRELKNTLERGVLISSRPMLTVQDFGAPPSDRGIDNTEKYDGPLSLRDVEHKVILGALEKTNGNRTHAAKALGISIRTLRNKLNEYKQEVMAGAEI